VGVFLKETDLIQVRTLLGPSLRVKHRVTRSLVDDSLPEATVSTNFFQGFPQTTSVARPLPQNVSLLSPTSIRKNEQRRIIFGGNGLIKNTTTTTPSLPDVHSLASYLDAKGIDVKLLSKALQDLTQKQGLLKPLEEQTQANTPSDPIKYEKPSVLKSNRPSLFSKKETHSRARLKSDLKTGQQSSSTYL